MKWVIGFVFIFISSILSNYVPARWRWLVGLLTGMVYAGVTHP